MKNKFEFSIALIIGLAMVTITISIWNETILLSDSTDSEAYDSKYSYLITRDAYAIISKSAKFVPERTCFEIGNNRELNDYSKGFQEALHEASQTTDDGMYDPDYFIGFQLRGSHFDLSTSEAVTYLAKYNFDEKILDFALAEKRAGYNVTEGYSDLAISGLRYSCFFIYDGEQYLLQIAFHPMVPYMGNFTEIDITESLEDNESKPILTNPEITVYHNFNSTVVVNNNLDKDVVLMFSFITPKSKDRLAPNDVTIPSGMSLTYYFDNYYTGGKIPYSYVIKPYGLEGSILVKLPPDCMTESEAISLYSKVGKKLKFPQYIPKDYQFQCGNFVTTREILVGYDDSGVLQDNLKLLTNYKERQKYFDMGGIVIDYYYMNDAKRDCNLTQNVSEHFQIGKDILAVYGKIDNPTTGERWDFLRICTDTAVHNIKGNISQDEMTKIAESIYIK